MTNPTDAAVSNAPDTTLTGTSLIISYSLLYIVGKPCQPLRGYVCRVLFDLALQEVHQRRTRCKLLKIFQESAVFYEVKN